MLRILYPRDYRRYEGSRFAVELVQFAEWLRDLGYSRHCMRGHLFRLKKGLEGSKRFEPGGTFCDEDLRDAFTFRSPCVELYRGTQRAFSRFLRPMGRLTRASPLNASEILCQRYRQYLSEVRGFSRSTAQQHGSTLQDFLSRGLPESAELTNVTAADVENYVQLRSKEVTRHTLQHIVAHLRAFLRYCASQGKTRRGLDCIDTPRTYRGELPPRALDWNLIRTLLASVDRQSLNGRRDYTILHLMANYGLRPSEIASLRLDSIDWNAQTIQVDQCKTQSVLVLPLANQTTRMLRRYVLGRPSCDQPELFLRARSPIRALTHYAVVDVFAKRAQQSGLPLQGVSSYALRHSFAMRLLHRGVGVKTIGDLLGHHSLESTCVYLRLDTDMLRAVALPVPAVATL